MSRQHGYHLLDKVRSPTNSSGSVMLPYELNGLTLFFEPSTIYQYLHCDGFMARTGSEIQRRVHRWPSTVISRPN